MNLTAETLPNTAGFYMPGEHTPQEEVWMAWPVRADNWRFGAKFAQAAFVEVAHTIAQATPVVMLVDSSQYENARAMLNAEIKVVEMSYNDCWMRDIGATYVLDDKGQRAGINWEFNAWGGLVDGLYFPWDQDNLVADKMLQLTNDHMFKAPIVLEGGSIHVDGEGTLFTTEECLLHPSRNPDMSKAEIEDCLKAYLGISKVIWLPRGLYNDETNGHIDNIMHVIGPGKVALTWCDDPNDPQYAISQEAFEVLSNTLDAKGRALQVYKLPMPGPLYIKASEADGIDFSDGMEREQGERLAASYANFLISNQQVIFPLLDPKNDTQAKLCLQEAFPEHQVVGVNAREILLGGGNIHCITQQVPALKIS